MFCKYISYCPYFISHGKVQNVLRLLYNPSAEGRLKAFRKLIRSIRISLNASDCISSWGDTGMEGETIATFPSGPNK